MKENNDLNPSVNHNLEKTYNHYNKSNNLITKIPSSKDLDTDSPDLEQNTKVFLIQRSISMDLRKQISFEAYKSLSNIGSKHITPETLSKVRKEIIGVFKEQGFEFQDTDILLVTMILNFIALLLKAQRKKRKIVVSKIAKECHKPKVMKLTSWLVNAYDIINNLEEKINNSFFRYGSFSEELDDEYLISLKRYKNYYRLINNRTILYPDLDFETTIKITYEGICQGFGDGHCEFNIDFHFIPSLELHHILRDYRKKIINPSYKYLHISNLLRYDFDTVLDKIATQAGGLRLCCRNHHQLFGSLRFNYLPIYNFLHDFHTEDLLNSPPAIREKSNRLSLEFYKKFLGNKGWHDNKINRSLWAFVKKKYVIEFLFGKNYICPICQKVNTNEHLPCFVAHHTNNSLFEDNETKKIMFKQKFLSKRINWLIKSLIIQECVFICQNCHAMIHAPYYKKLSSYIFENNDLDIQFLNKYYNELNIKIGNVVKEVLSLKRKLREGEIIIKEPIGKIFKKSEILERNLVAIYFICKKFPPFHFQDYFLRTDLASTLGKNREQYFRKSGRSSGKRNVLLKLKYIINTGYRIERSPLFKLTNIGILKAQRIIKFKSMIYGKRFKSLVLGWKKNFDKIRSNITSKVFKILLHSAYNISELAQLTELKKSQIYSCVGDLKRKGMISCIGKRKDSKLWSAVL